MSAVPKGIIYRFGAHEGPKARESYRRYFDLKRRVEHKPPLQLIEHRGRWYATEPLPHRADNGA